MRVPLPSALFPILVIASVFRAEAGIQLSSFTGEGTPSGVHLDWTTLTETNNFGFHVQRSLNGEADFQTVPNSFVAGAGTTSIPQTYSYTDTGAPPGTWYYRLQQIDLAGPLHYTSGVLAHRPAYAQYLPDSTTRLLLHLDETAGAVAHDLSPFHTHGAITGATSAAGRFGAARLFSGALHGIRVPDSASLRPGTVTVEAWVTSSAFPAMGPGVIVTKRRAAGGASYTLRMSGTSGRACFVTGISPLDSAVSTSILQNGRWYHLAGVYDQTMLSIYVNGVLEASRPLAGSIPYDGGGLFAGTDSSGSATWQGAIDEIRISSGARSPEEFNLPLPPVSTSASLSGGRVLLGWQDGGGAVGLLRYRVYRGTDSTALSLRDSSVQNSYEDAQAPPDMFVYYRVAPVDSTGFEGRYGQTVFLRTPPAVPVPVSPADGATGVLPPVTLRWRASSGASAYRVQLAADSLFSAPILDDSTLADTTVQGGPLAGPVRYYWRVFSRGIAGSSAPSAVRRFDVVGVPAAVTLVAPDSGAVIAALQATLRWRTASPFADRYWLECAQNPLFTGGLVDSTLTDTLASVQQLQHGSVYWWRVRARNPQGWGPFSATRSFTAEFTLQVPLLAGWNMISLPVQTDADSLVEVYPSALSPHAFAFVPAQGYVLEYLLDAGRGYWAKFPAAGAQEVAGAPVALDSIAVGAGWNMIGSISVALDTALVVSVPPGIRTSPFFGYAGALAQVPTLEPGRAYWVKVSSPGVLVLREPARAARRERSPGR